MAFAKFNPCSPCCNIPCCSGLLTIIPFCQLGGITFESGFPSYLNINPSNVRFNVFDPWESSILYTCLPFLQPTGGLCGFTLPCPSYSAHNTNHFKYQIDWYGQSPSQSGSTLTCDNPTQLFGYNASVVNNRQDCYPCWVPLSGLRATYVADSDNQFISNLPSYWSCNDCLSQLCLTDSPANCCLPGSSQITWNLSIPHTFDVPLRQPNAGGGDPTFPFTLVSDWFVYREFTSIGYSVFPGPPVTLTTQSSGFIGITCSCAKSGVSLFNAKLYNDDLNITYFFSSGNFSSCKPMLGYSATSGNIVTCWIDPGVGFPFVSSKTFSYINSVTLYEM